MHKQCKARLGAHPTHPHMRTTLTEQEQTDNTRAAHCNTPAENWQYSLQIDTSNAAGDLVCTLHKPGCTSLHKAPGHLPAHFTSSAVYEPLHHKSTE
jgi:hypothetical protein